MTDETTTKRIAALNDQCRSALRTTSYSPSCRYVVTPGIRALDVATQRAIVLNVAQFTAFSPDNDPYGERDFGAFTQGQHRIFWKIDYYAPDLEHGSDDPADPTKTVRVLTIMLASEY